MKKLVFAFFTFMSLAVFSQERAAMRLGVQWGFHGNESVLSGGMEEADARFFHNSFGGGSLRIEGRYDFNKRWMLMTGMGFCSYGFEYALSENYSLKNEKNRFSTIRSEVGALEIPLMGFYKFNPNCRNKRWVVGLGLVNNLIGAQQISKQFKEDPEGNGQVRYLNSETKVNEGIYTMLRFSIGREKVFERGAIFNASMVFNTGFRNIATSNVVYTINGKEYNHEFKNNGNFIGLRFSYFFRPFENSLVSVPKN